MRVSLATKISTAILGVLSLALVSSVVAIGSAYRFKEMQETLVAHNLASVRAAEELEIALLEQRGYVSSYILDGGNLSWLDQLEERRNAFDYWLGQARLTARSDEERRILDELENVQAAYEEKRDSVVKLYDAGEEERATHVLLTDVPDLYKRTYDLCEEFIAANQTLVESASTRMRLQVEQITFLGTLLLLVTIGLGFALLWLFFQGVVFPLRRIAADVRGAAGNEDQQPTPSRTDELRELGRYVNLLMSNVAETRSDLEQSRAQLAHADRLAAVGKLAASVAHEIRNPLTAVKMWLYSLRRSASQDAEVQQKFGIIADEISRLEGIVRHFLEFARPPRLKPQSQPIEPLIAKTLELLQHRLQDERVVVVREADANLPLVKADTEQLRQVFLNLLNNAMEAMPDGGEIHIACSRGRHGGREMVAVRVSDSGTGMAGDVRQRIFEPFFTTKDEGTGLGLCIAASVMARHAGSLELDWSNGSGTRWTVWIPATT